MEPRLEAVRSKRICIDDEVFELDITKYEPASRGWLRVRDKGIPRLLRVSI